MTTVTLSFDVEDPDADLVHDAIRAASAVATNRAVQVHDGTSWSTQTYLPPLDADPIVAAVAVTAAELEQVREVLA